MLFIRLCLCFFVICTARAANVLTITFENGTGIHSNILVDFRLIGNSERAEINLPDYDILGSITGGNLVTLERGIMRARNGFREGPSTFRMRYAGTLNIGYNEYPDTFIAEIIQDPLTVDPNIPLCVAEVFCAGGVPLASVRILVDEDDTEAANLCSQ